MLGIKISEIQDFLEKISNKTPVYVPVKQNNTTDFMRFDKSKNVDIITQKTNKSPKNMFFDTYENITLIVRDGKSFTVNEFPKNTEEFVIFGVKACDEKGFKVLDNVFLSEPCDEFYKAKRNSATIITLSCNTFEPECFCTNFNITPYDPDGDIAMFNTGEYLIFEDKTPKGRQFLEKYAELFININFDIENFKNNLKQKFDNLPLKNLNLKQFGEKDMMKLFNDERWEELSKTCLGCGSCTFFCPTCQCYDIRDFKNGNEITRYRCWDSCMYSDFTMVAGGGNPRKTQKERFRQRFMHKLVYYPSNYNGIFSCVGCGRCLKVCPNHLNIVKVIKRLGE